MAEVLIRKIIFLDSSLGYSTDDIVDIYYDETVDATAAGGTNGITVYLNDVQVFSGNTINPAYSSSKIEVHIHASLCNGTTLISFSRTITFPFIVGAPFENSVSCGYVGAICDLTVNGSPIITGATDDGAADGAISVVPTSSNGPIQYNLTEETEYNGPNQLGSVISGSNISITELLPGTYTLYLVDSLNCRTSLVFTINVEYSYGAENILRYTDRLGLSTQIELQRKGYSGAVNLQMCGSGDPFTLSLRGEGGIDKFVPLLGTECTLEITSETNFEWHTLFTNDPTGLKIAYYKDFGGGYTKIWQGFVVPQQYQEPYKVNPYYVTLQATDRLAYLRDFYLASPEGNRLFGTMKQIELLAYCLKATGLFLNIRVACNIYATGMNQTATDDPLDQAYVDLDTYYLASDGFPSLDFVIKSILEPYGARIILFDNRWTIIRVEELIGSYDYREFDKNGVYSSNGTTDPVLNISPTGDLRWSDRDQNLSIVPGYGRIVIDYNLGLKPNILKNGDFTLKNVFDTNDSTYSQEIDFTGWQLISPNYSIITTYENVDNEDDKVALRLSSNYLGDGSGYIKSETYNISMGANDLLKFRIRCKINPIKADSRAQYFDGEYIKVRALVQYGTYYLRADGSWASSSEEMVFYVKEYNKYIDLEVTANYPDLGASAGYDFTVIVYQTYQWHTGYASDYQDIKDIVTVGKGDGGDLIEFLDDTGTYWTEDRIVYYRLEPLSGILFGGQPGRVTPDDVGSSGLYWNMINNKVVSKSTGNANAINDDFFIDTVELQFLTSGRLGDKSEVIVISGETNNSLVYEKEVFHGSYSQTITTAPLYKRDRTGITLIGTRTTAALPFGAVYSGYLRDSAGTGWEFWKRDAIAESAHLTEILGESLAIQYNASSRALSGTTAMINWVGFLNSFTESNDSDRPYVPISMTIIDRTSQVNLELLELKDVTDTQPPSAFSTGFKQTAFE